MSKLKIIECEECGAPRATRWKNTKYCFNCRLIRNLDFLNGRTKKCLGCGKDFLLLNRNDELCGECDTRPVHKGLVGECAFCHEPEQPLIGENIRVCKRCAHDPSKRGVLMKALIAKQRKIQSGEIVIPPPEIPKSKKAAPDEPVPEV